MCISTGDTWVCAAVCRFPLPDEAKRLDNGHRRIQTEQQPPTGIYLLKDNDRVLVVEDESLVAMMMVEALVEMGLSIVGPFSNTADAIRAVKETPVAAAILDINLGDELVYPVADLLTSARHSVRLRHRLWFGPARSPISARAGFVEAGGQEHFAGSFSQEWRDAATYRR